MNLKTDPLSWAWIKWEMALLVIISVTLIYLSDDKLNSALLIPIIPIAFKLVFNWKGLKSNEPKEKPQQGGPAYPPQGVGSADP